MFEAQQARRALRVIAKRAPEVLSALPVQPVHKALEVKQVRVARRWSGHPVL